MACDQRPDRLPSSPIKLRAAVWTGYASSNKTQLGPDRLTYTSAQSISKICIRPCEPVHIFPARLVPPSNGAVQRGRGKCVPSFLPSRRLRPFSQLAYPRSQLTSIGIACRATTMPARAIVGSPATTTSGRRIGPHGLLRGQFLSRERRRPGNCCQAASSLTPRASRANSDL